MIAKQWMTSLRQRLEGSRGDIRERLTRSLNAADKSAVSFGQSVSRARPQIRKLEADARHVTETVRSLRGPVGRAGDVAKEDRAGGLGIDQIARFQTLYRWRFKRERDPGEQDRIEAMKGLGPRIAHLCWEEICSRIEAKEHHVTTQRSGNPR